MMVHAVKPSPTTIDIDIGNEKSMAALSKNMNYEALAKPHETVREHFRRVDRGDPRFSDIYTDDIEFYFPKFGFGHGKDAIAELARRLDLERLEHDIDGLDIMTSGDRVIVEGREWGTTREGRTWPDGEISRGLFCNVFTFRGHLICKLHVYTDPDFTSSHQEKVQQLHRG
ncbi:nuclear transport factor 2 family protein [Streptomyces sp. NPDC002870]|uniref:nuclear transport factor 2 family protein n=1 Tax=Streptomyces sp. NPDC002870 TaxID=3364666 RepID=UPI0036989D3A